MEFLNRFIKAAALIAVTMVKFRQWVQKGTNEQVADAQPLQTTPNTNDIGNKGNTSGSNAGNTAIIDTHGVVPTPTIFDFQQPDIQYPGEGYFEVPFNPIQLGNNEDEDGSFAECQSVICIPTPYHRPPISLTPRTSCDGPEPVIVASLADCLGPRPLFDPVEQAAWDRAQAGAAVGESFDIQGNYANSDTSMEALIQELLAIEGIHPADLILASASTDDMKAWNAAVYSASDQWGVDNGDPYARATTINAINRGTRAQHLPENVWEGVMFTFDTITSLGMAGVSLQTAGRNNPAMVSDLLVSQEEYSRFLGARGVPGIYYEVPSDTPGFLHVARIGLEQTPGNALSLWNGASVPAVPYTNTLLPGGNVPLFTPGSYYNNSWWSGFTPNSPFYVPPGASVGIPQPIELGGSNNSSAIGRQARWQQIWADTGDGNVQISVVARQGGDGSDDLPPMPLGIGSSDSGSGENLPPLMNNVSNNESSSGVDPIEFQTRGARISLIEQKARWRARNAASPEQAALEWAPGVTIVNQDGSDAGEFDITLANDQVFIENKSGRELSEYPQVDDLTRSIQWAEDHIYDETVDKIDALLGPDVARTRSMPGESTFPELVEIMSIRRYHFQVATQAPQVIDAVNTQLARLQEKYSGWTFSVEFIQPSAFKPE